MNRKRHQKPTAPSTKTKALARRRSARAPAEPGPSAAPASGADTGPETVLLAVVGMSPAILTETLWALAHQAEPVIPHRVIAVTTTEGRDRLLSLFQPSRQLGGVSPWEALRQALQAAGHDLTKRLRFGDTPDDIRVITAVDPATSRSRQLADIRDRTDNEAAADFILEQVRALVENPDTHLIASIAGGRKTMSALLYACLTLIGRETDRLTHVLVSQPFENLPDFWFPGQPGGPILKSEIRNPKSQTVFDPASALVDLADVPFVPLRNLFRRELGQPAGSFLRLVDSCRVDLRRRAAAHLQLSLDPVRAELEVNGQVFKLAPTEMLVALFLARRAKQNERAYTAYKDALDDLNAFRQEQCATTNHFGDWRQASSLRVPWDERDLVKAVSSLRDKLRKRGGDAAILAACLPEKGRCSLDIPGPMIFIK